MNKQKAILSRIKFPGRQATFADEMVDMVSCEVTAGMISNPMTVTLSASEVGGTPNCVYGAFITDKDGKKKGVGSVSWGGDSDAAVNVLCPDGWAAGDYLTVLVSFPE